MNILKDINALLAFLLEIAMIFAFGYFGYQVGPNVWVSWILALALPLLVVIIWSVFFAPRSQRRLPALPGVLLSLGLFLLAALALYQVQQPIAAMTLAVVAVMNRIFVFLWRQWGEEKIA